MHRKLTASFATIIGATLAGAGPSKPRSRWGAATCAALAALAFLLQACQQESILESREYAYTNEAKGDLRDQLGPQSRIIASTRSGQRVEILERLNRWARVRVISEEAGSSGPPLEGWMHQRQMVSEEVFQQFAEMAEEAREFPAQGQALVRRLANMRLKPGRTTQAFYQLAPDEKIESLRHAVASREPTADDIRRGTTEPISEDWLLIRASGGRTGWVLESFIELVPPIEVARYREGQRIRAWFEIYQERDGDQTHPWYLWATVPRLSGAAHDFEEIRVLVWNPQMDRYETSYRERDLKGFLPILVSVQDEPGAYPAFSFEHERADGTKAGRNYFMTGRRVQLRREAP